MPVDVYLWNRPGRSRFGQKKGGKFKFDRWLYYRGPSLCLCVGRYWSPAIARCDQMLPGGDQVLPGGDQVLPGGDQVLPGGDKV